jgi:hypothetical protein
MVDEFDVDGWLTAHGTTYPHDSHCWRKTATRFGNVGDACSCYSELRLPATETPFLACLRSGAQGEDAKTYIVLYALEKRSLRAVLDVPISLESQDGMPTLAFVPMVRGDSVVFVGDGCATCPLALELRGRAGNALLLRDTQAVCAAGSREYRWRQGQLVSSVRSSPFAPAPSATR